MSGFVKQIFISGMMFFRCNLKVNPLKCVSMNIQKCKVRPYFPFSIETSKYSGSCNNINDPHAKILCS